MCACCILRSFQKEPGKFLIGHVVSVSAEGTRVLEAGVPVYLWSWEVTHVVTCSNKTFFILSSVQIYGTLSRFKLWCYAAELKQEPRHGDRYFVAWYNQELVMVSPDSCDELYMKLSVWRMKYETCLDVPGPTLPVIFYSANVCHNPAGCGKSLCRVALADHGEVPSMNFFERAGLSEYGHRYVAPG